MEKEMEEKQQAKLRESGGVGQKTQEGLDTRGSLLPSLIEESNSCDTFIEYFYVFGANETTVKKEEFYIHEYFTRPNYLKMQLLSKFPPYEKPNSNIDESVIMNHCFPKGFTLLNLTKKDEIPRNECFHFSLENLHSLTEDDKIIYFTCYTFYEPLSVYYEILMRIKKHIKGSQGKLKPLTSKQKELIEGYYVPKAICLSSFVPFPNEEKYLLTKILAYVKGMTKGIGSNIIVPIEKVIEKLVLGIPRPPKGKFFVSYKNNNCIIPNTENDYNIMQRELNQYNYYSYKMHLIFIFKVDEIMEIFKCLLLEVPILFFSESKEKLTNIFETFLFLMSPFEYQYPHCSILPDTNCAIIEIAKSFAFGINHEWVEPNNKDKKETYFEEHNLNVFNKSIRIVDIDHHCLSSYFCQDPTQHIVLFNDLGESYKDLGGDLDLSVIKSKEINHDVCNEAINYALSLHYIGKFKKRLAEFLDNNKMKTSDCSMPLNRKIGEEYFYYLLVCIFQNYNRYLFNGEYETKKIIKDILEKDIDKIPIENLFKASQFAKDMKGGSDMFLTRFFETKIFKNFIVRKYLNGNNDRFIFLHFDETILSKRNRSFFSRKTKTEFIESKILQATHCYGVDTTKNFSQEEYSFISQHQNNLIFYYQRFNGILFNYYLFPKLIYDNKYFEKLYIPPKFFDKFLYEQMQDYQKSIETLEQPKYFEIYNLVQRNLFDKNNLIYNNEIKNDIILLWLRMFCLTFYYCEPKEKLIRFVEMLDNVQKAEYLRDNILSLLLITIKKFGDEYMIIKLFEHIKNFNYNQFSYVSNKLIAPNIRESPPLKQLSIANSKLLINYYKFLKEDEIKLFDLNIKNLDTLKHRTIWGDGIEGKPEKIKFEDPVCPKCNKKIDLKKLLTNYEFMPKSNQLKCLHCKDYISPVTEVKIGTNKDDMEISKINIYNPYFLYNNISTKLTKVYGNKIDLNDLRNLYSDFFWNCILYFSSADLSCDMLLQYNKTYKIKIEEKKPVVPVKEPSSSKKGKKGDNKPSDKDKGKNNEANAANKVNKRGNLFTNLEISSKIIEINLK